MVISKISLYFNISGRMPYTAVGKYAKKSGGKTSVTMSSLRRWFWYLEVPKISLHGLQKTSLPKVCYWLLWIQTLLVMIQHFQIPFDIVRTKLLIIFRYSNIYTILKYFVAPRTIGSVWSVLRAGKYGKNLELGSSKVFLNIFFQIKTLGPKKIVQDLCETMTAAVMKIGKSGRGTKEDILALKVPMVNI